MSQVSVRWSMRSWWVRTNWSGSAAASPAPPVPSSCVVPPLTCWVRLCYYLVVVFWVVCTSHVGEFKCWLPLICLCIVDMCVFPLHLITLTLSLCSYLFFHHHHHHYLQRRRSALCTTLCACWRRPSRRPAWSAAEAAWRCSWPPPSTSKY